MSQPTVQSVLHPAEQRLKAAGSPTPALDAQLWLAHLCGRGRAHLLAHPEQSIPPALLARFQAGIDRLAAGEPLPYLTGRIEFYGLSFRVSAQTLIPRPETEHLVDAALAWVTASGQSQPQIADIGTGSGCVAIALARHLPQAQIFAIDISPAALAVACDNAAQHNVADRVTFLPGDLLDPLQHSQQRVHLVVANLPYVTDREWEALPISVRQYEPAGALQGGPDGLALIDRLLAGAPGILHPAGAILLEIGASQGAAAARLAQARLPGAQVQIQPDYAGRDRLLIIDVESQPVTTTERRLQP